MKRIWLDWSRPCLQQAAEWLVEQNRNDQSHCDMQRVLSVSPGARSGRILLQELIERCNKRDLKLVPPTVVTPGPMVDLLLEPVGSGVSSSERILGWMTALREVEAAALEPLFPSPPDTDDHLAWLDLAGTVADLHEELAGGGITFAEVARQAEKREMLFAEKDRWAGLETVHQQYREVLDKCGLCDPHHKRLKLLETQSVGEQFESIVLIGVVELNRVQRWVLEHVEAKSTALVFAPESMSDSFDELGCVDTDCWMDATIDIDDDAIEVCERPTDQAQAAIRTIARYADEFAAEEITIGLGDASLGDALQRGGKWAGVSLHPPAGKPLRQTGPFRLLEAIAEWLAEPRFAHLATLVRHPDLEEWLIAQTDGRLQQMGVSEWASLLDQYFSDHLHQRFDGNWLGDARTQQQLRTIYRAVNELTAPLGGQPQPLGEWIEPMLSVLRAIYTDTKPQESHITDACLAIRDCLAELAAAPQRFDLYLTGSDAMRVVCQLLRRSHLTEQIQPKQIEMLGWLELLLDPAPALILAGVNDGAIPAAVTGDAFLPDQLRQSLGLMTNQRRYARDAYLLTAICASRKRLTLLTGRRSVDDEPLTPSRLLLACDDATLLRRIDQFCGESRRSETALPIGLEPSRDASHFVLPTLPHEPPALQSLRVTDFRAYLACPYRFALAKVSGLEESTDRRFELDPLQFGTLAHRVLESFGNDTAICDSTSPEQIEIYLNEQLDRRVAKRYGKELLPAVAVQVARLKQRFRSFAKHQAELRDQGWEIAHCELKFREQAKLDIPGQPPMGLRGTIDRIDFHAETNRWRVIDYKTGDSGKSPHKVHHDRKTIPDIDSMRWLDLQLPLYHHLVCQRGVCESGKIELGYFILPRQTDGATFKPAQWKSQHLDNAIELARDIVRKIRAGEFEINPDYPHKTSDSFARICQTSVLGAAHENALEGNTDR